MKERTEVNPAQNLALALCGTNFRNQVLTEAGVFCGIIDKTLRDIDPAFRSRHHGQLLICHDTIKAHMALLHDMCTWCCSLRKIPLLSCRIIVQADLAGSTGQ